MADQKSLTPAQIVAYKQLVQQVYVGILDAVDRLDKAIGVAADARWKDQLALYKRLRDNSFTPQVQNVLALPDNDSFWSSRARMEKFMAGLESFIDQVKTTSISAKVGFWDGFLDTLAERGKQIYQDLPSPLEWLKWAPWVIAGAFVLPTLFRAFAGYKRGGAAAAAEAAAEGIESTRRTVGEGAKSLARRAASGGTMSGSPRRRRRSR